MTDHDQGHAGSDGGSAPELIASATDEPSSGELLREELERSAVAWVRRHRLSMSLLATLAVLVAAGTAYVVSRPPAPDPVVRIDILAARDGTFATSGVDPQGRRWGTWQYIVSTRVAGDVDAMLGIVGPGLTDPTSTISNVAVAHLGVGSLGATADCSDAAWWNADDADYRARVTRTDTYGRTLTANLPLGAATAAMWHARVRLACLDTFVQALPPAAASTSVRTGRRAADVTLTLTNPSGHDVWVSAAWFDDVGASWGPRDASVVDGNVTDLPRTALPAGGTASVRLSLLTYDCALGTPHLPSGRTPTGAVSGDKALPGYVSATASPTEEQLAGSWVRIDPASADQADRALTALCP